MDMDTSVGPPPEAMPTAAPADTRTVISSAPTASCTSPPAIIATPTRVRFDQLKLARCDRDRIAPQLMSRVAPPASRLDERVSFLRAPAAASIGARWRAFL